MSLLSSPVGRLQIRLMRLHIWVDRLSNPSLQLDHLLVPRFLAPSLWHDREKIGMLSGKSLMHRVACDQTTLRGGSYGSSYLF